MIQDFNFSSRCCGIVWYVRNATHLRILLSYVFYKGASPAAWTVAGSRDAQNVGSVAAKDGDQTKRQQLRVLHAQCDGENERLLLLLQLY